MSSYKSSHSRKIGDIIHQNEDSLAHLVSHSLELLELQKRIRHELGPPLDDHMHLASVSPAVLKIVTGSAVWAAKLRFQTTRILEIARTLPGCEDLKTVRIKISPSGEHIFRSKNSFSISSETSLLLRKVADGINDPELRATLLRLSQNYQTTKQ